MATRTPATTFETDATGVNPGELTLREVVGREAMSSLYEYEVTLETQIDGGLSPEAIDGLLSSPCRLVGTTHEVSGLLREIELLEATEPRPVRYRAVLVPSLWNATRTYRSRVYQDMNVKQLVDRVLAQSDLKPEWRLADEGLYPKREDVVQYEETDFDFVSRQLEHWGLYYYFRQEAGGEVLVIADHDLQFEAHPDHETLTFNPRLGRTGVGGSVHSMRALFRPQPRIVKVRDYNYRAPSVPLAEQREVDSRTGQGTQWYDGEHFKDSDEGKVIARIRAEQLLNLRERYTGTCTAPGLAPGHRFTLEGCPLPELNATYLLTELSSRLTITADGGDETYQASFVAVPIARDNPKSVPYRSQRRTAWPVIAGFMHGVVDGEAPGTAAPIDDQGRYKIVLPFDSVAQPGGKASSWIRMAQPSAGQNYGIHFPLHIGTEVAIIHLDGDPDRPLIMGSVPNADTMSPVVQDSATQSRIKTKSGILVEFDDDAL